MVNNGPFQLEKEQQDNRLLLCLNPQYSGQFRGNISQVDCAVVEDYEQTLQAFSQDQLDAVNLTYANPETVTRAKALFGKAVVSIPRWSTFYLSFRCDKPPFDDRRVRQALAYAIDREALVEQGFQGLRQVATGGFVPPGMPGHSPNIALPFDPQKGRALLVRAGYPGGMGFPNVEWAASPGGNRVISFISRAWQEHLGLHLVPARMDWEVFMEKLNDDPAQLTLLGWSADFPDPHIMLRATFHSQEGINVPHWKNEQFDDLTAEAESITEHNWRMSLYQEADRILVAERNGRLTSEL